MILHGRIYTSTRLWRKSMRRLFFQRLFATKATEWKPTVGLEVHAQIATDTKLFSDAPVSFTDPVNSCVSLFDCAMPGTMPVLNKKCVEAGVLTALALSCEINEVSMFERKHYFYADLPAGFQITQQKKPLAVNGELRFDVYTPGVHTAPYPKSSRIKQIQLEQDSGKSLHNEIEEKSLIDLNRAGVPLMELVFEPDLSDGEEAAALVKELIVVLELLGTCSCKMEEGALRIDANISVSKPGEPLGVRTELKNIGSVRAVAAAIKFEIQRQISVLEKGGQIINETRGWDIQSKKSISMREKEEKEDYRFMPETNLPPLFLHVDENSANENSLVDVAALKKQIPVLPEEEREELRKVYGISPTMIIVLMGNLMLRRIFYDLVKANRDRTPQLTALILGNEILTLVKTHNVNLSYFSSVYQQNFVGEVIDLVQSKSINLIIAKRVLKTVFTETSKMPKEIVEENDWFLISDEKKLEEVCLDVIEKNPKIVKKCKSGKQQEIAKLINKVATATDQRANMILACEIMRRLLN